MPSVSMLLRGQPTTDGSSGFPSACVEANPSSRAMCVQISLFLFPHRDFVQLSFTSER